MPTLMNLRPMDPQIPSDSLGVSSAYAAYAIADPNVPLRSDLVKRRRFKGTWLAWIVSQYLKL